MEHPPSWMPTQADTLRSDALCRAAAVSTASTAAEGEKPREAGSKRDEGNKKACGSRLTNNSIILNKIPDSFISNNGMKKYGISIFSLILKI